jgi:ATP-dependent DNA helicase PIF1
MTEIDEIETRNSRKYAPAIRAGNQLRATFRLESNVNNDSSAWRTHYIPAVFASIAEITIDRLAALIVNSLDGNKIAGSDTFVSARDERDAIWRVRHVSVEFQRQTGAGCGGRGYETTHPVMDEDGRVIHHYLIIDPMCEADSNDCAIRALMEGFKRAYTQLPPGMRKSSSLRAKSGIYHGNMLTYDEIDLVADALRCNYIVYDENSTLRHHHYVDGGVYTFSLLHKEQHMYLILEIVGTCPCGQANTDNHSCENSLRECPTCKLHVDMRTHRCAWEQAIVDKRHRMRRQMEISRDQKRGELRRKRDEVEEITKESETGRDSVMNAVIDNVFVKKVRVQLVIGQAGTGKTYTAVKTVLEHNATLAASGHSMNIEVVAPTGAAATQIDHRATTINNCIKCGVGKGSGDQWAQELLLGAEANSATIEMIRSLDLLIVDEISMIKGEFLDKMDVFFRAMRGEYHHLPFGGIRMLFVGDVMQLPPVTDSSDYIDFFFDSRVYAEVLSMPGAMDRQIMETPKRYPCVDWFGTLSRVRKGVMNQRDVTKILSRTVTQSHIENVNSSRNRPILFLASTNKVINAYNFKYMSALNTESHSYTARDINPAACKNLDQYAPKKLLLKVEGVVMLTVNHGKGTSYLEEHGVGNGSRGRVVALSDASADVLFFQTDEVVTVSLQEYLEDLPNGRTAGRVQLPLIQAYGITIHRAQGCTIREEVLIDLDNLFEFHMLYTALSRVSRLEDLMIMNWSADYRVNQRCLDWLEKDLDAMPPVGVYQNDAGTYVSNTVEAVATTGERNFACRRFTRLDNSAVSHMIDQKSIIFDVSVHVPSGQESDDARVNVKIWDIQALLLTSNEDPRYYRFRRVGDTGDPLLQFGEWLFGLLEEDCNEWDNLKGEKNSSLKAWRKMPYQIVTDEGCGFDFLYLLQYLFENGMDGRFRSTQIFKGTNLAYFSLRDSATKKEAAVIHDICQVLNCNFETACETYIGTTERQENPSLFERRVWPNKAVVSSDDCWRWTIRDFSREDFGVSDLEYLDAANRFEVEEILTRSFGPCLVHIDPETDKFEGALNVEFRKAQTNARRLKVDMLRTLYKSVDDQIAPYIGGVSVMRFCTANALSLYGIMTNLPPEVCMATGAYNKIESRIYRLSGDKEQFVAESVLGGKTTINCDAFISEDLTNGNHEIDTSDPHWHQKHDALVMLDVNGMYPSVMKNWEMPYGVPEWGTFEDLDRVAQILSDPFQWNRLLKDQCFIARVDYQGRRDEFEPPYALKNDDGKTVWDVAKQTDTVMTCWDIYLVLKTGGTVDNISQILIWPRKTKIYEQWIDKCFELKEKGERENNRAMRSFGKLLSNTAFGSTLKGSRLFTTAICTTKEHFDAFYEKATWNGSYPCGEALCMWGEAVRDESNSVSASGMQGAFVLAATRIERQRFISRLQEGDLTSGERVIREERFAFYQDTDSALIHCRHLPKILSLLGDGPGQWSCDLTKSGQWDYRKTIPNLVLPAVITKFLTVAPKAYSYEATLLAPPPGETVRRRTSILKSDAKASKWKGVMSGSESILSMPGEETCADLDITVFENIFRNRNTEGVADTVLDTEHYILRRLPAWCLTYADRCQQMVPFAVTREKRSLCFRMKQYELRTAIHSKGLGDGTISTVYAPLSYNM